jgi:hypothetical protein
MSVDSQRARQLACGQGVFFVATGLWPILHIRSFEAVTGPKVDRWLVKTMGGLIAVVGVTLVVGSTDRRVSQPLHLLGAASAAALAAADVIYASKRRISPIYLADAVVEAALTGAWLAARSQKGARV